MTNLEKMLIKHEGLKLKPYRCPAGKLTIGVGRNIEDNGISESEALYLLRHDIKRCKSELNEIFKDFNDLPKEIQNVLVDMIFNLGKTRFLKFEKMIQAVKNEDYEEMVKQMKDSKWCKQVKSRCDELSKIVSEYIKNGVT